MAAPHPALSTTTGASPGIDAITRRGERAGLLDAAGMTVESTAAVAAAPRQRRAGARGAHDPERGAVDVALPRIHHASREQVRVGGRRRLGDERGAHRARPTSDGSEKRRGTSRSFWPARSSQLDATSSP